MTRPHRLFVSGGSRLSEKAAILWRELGRLLAADNGLIVMTGGLARRRDAVGTKAADLAIVEGVREGLAALRLSAEERIETYLPDGDKDWDQLIRFREGRVYVLQHRTPQSRRFTMVHAADVVISIEGEHGTRSVVDAALAIERRVLPLPFGEGASRDLWKDLQAEIGEWFQIPRDELGRLDRIRFAGMTDGDLVALARRVHGHLMRGFTYTCFVIMPFGKEHEPVYERAIRPALATQGFHAMRTDRTVLAGSVVDAIREGLRHCHFAVADITGDRANVMYELGMAHGARKPVVLLRRAAPEGGEPSIPFDVRTESIIEYDDDLDDLRRRLEGAVAVVSGKVKSLDDVQS
jgi:hypothetical protein